MTELPVSVKMTCPHCLFVFFATTHEDFSGHVDTCKNNPKNFNNLNDINNNVIDKFNKNINTRAMMN